MKVVADSPLGLYHFEDWFIHKLSKKEYQFYIDPWEGRFILYKDNRIFSTYDMCFRAARKWMRDHQNEIYG